MIDRLKARGHAELVHDFNFQFPARVVAQVIGLPPENYHQFQTWAIDIVGVAGDPMPGIAASQAFREYLKLFIEARRAQAQDDMISELVRAEIDGEKLEPEDIMSFLLLLLPAGTETTYRSLGSLLFNLLTHPEQLEAVRKDRSLV